jgi:FixJ family two-component response regulator
LDLWCVVRTNRFIPGWQDLKLSKAPVISIVDDDQSVRESVASLVRSLGHTTATFSSAEEYLDSAHFRDSSCLITDLRMPGMSGADLQARLVAQDCTIPIIVMSASGDEGVRKRILNAGACGFLRKPIQDQHLIDCLNEALKRTGGRTVVK